MQIKTDQIWRSKFYNDDIRLIIHSVDIRCDIVSAYVYDIDYSNNAGFNNYILSTFQEYYELVEE